MVFIVVPLHNRLESTKKFLESMCSQQDAELHLVLVDDGSTDGTAEFLSAWRNLPTTVLKGDGELWWGGAVNAGLDFVLARPCLKKEDVVILANNDTELPKNALSFLRDALEENPVALLHPRIYGRMGRELKSGARVKSWFPFRTDYPTGFSEEYCSIDLAPARFLALRVKTLQKLGNIHPLLPHYVGDNEFSLRACRAGHPVLLCRNLSCALDDTCPEWEERTISSLWVFIYSFFWGNSSLRLKYRWIFLRTKFGCIFSSFVLASMVIKDLLRRLFPGYFFSGWRD